MECSSARLTAVMMTINSDKRLVGSRERTRATSRAWAGSYQDRSDPCASPLPKPVWTFES